MIKFRPFITATRDALLPAGKVIALMTTFFAAFFVLAQIWPVFVDHWHTFCAFGVVVLWLRTGRDPLYWLIKSLIAFRAVLAVIGSMAVEAISVFREDFPKAFEQGKKEVGA